MKGEKELNKLYGDASRELRSVLLSIDPESYSDRRAAEINDRIRRIVAALNIGTYEWADVYLKEAYTIGAKKSRTALEILGKQPQRLLLNTERIFIEDTVELLTKRNNTIRESASRYLGLMALAVRGLGSVQIQEWSYADAAAELDAIVAEAMAAQKSRGWLARKLIDYLQSLIVAGELIEINNKMWKMSAYSRMVSRTTLRTAQSRATEDLCKQFENDLVEISDHGTETEICQEYEGKVFSISGKTPGYDILDQWPPFHPNCQHSPTPTSEEALIVRRRYH